MCWPCTRAAEEEEAAEGEKIAGDNETSEGEQIRGINATDANLLDVPVLSEILIARLPFFVKIRTEDPREKVLDRILTKRDITNCYAWPDGLTPANTNAP